MEKKILQVNGKAYDAVTGRRIDGFIAPKKSVSVRISESETAAHVPIHSSAHSARQTNHAFRHQQQHAKTLVRRAVHQPKAGLKKQVHVQHELAPSQVQSITVKHTATHLDAGRAQRAHGVEKHAQVHRFGAPQTVPVTFASVPVQQAPADAQVNDPPAVPPPTSITKPVDMFEQAIQNATHYVDIAEQKVHFKKRAKHHAIGMAAGVFALLAIAGFTMYQNTPKLQMKVAGVVAGISTKAPDFQSAGFTYDGVSAHGSKLVYGFKSELARYQLVEQATNWTGDEMIQQVSSVGANGAPNYTVLSVGNVSVYKFNDRNATWIQYGTWYQVHGDQPLTDAQLSALVKHS